MGDLAGRAHQMGWWPYCGRGDGAAAPSAPATGSPTLHSGDSDIVATYTLASSHLQRAVVSAAACARGQRAVWEHPKLMEALPQISDTATPAGCDAMARWLARQLPDLAPAARDPDATREVLDALADTCRGILTARRLLEAWGPPQIGARPTKPARRHR